jgi:GT2 family glycosyltransferase
MDVSIIIVNWNTKDILKDCLKSVYEQTKDINYEIIVVDNASTDGSTDMVKKQFPQIILLENSENRGFAAANNRGIAVAKGRYVLLLNSDTIVLENAIAGTVSFADAHTDAAIVGCRVLNSDRTLQSTCFMFPSLLNMLLSSTYLYKLFPHSKFWGREQMTWWDRQDVRQVDAVTGCFMLVRQDAINQVGIMDERYFMYCEETDWCYRFKKAGWKILFTPDAKIIHLRQASTDQIADKMLLQLRGSRLMFLKKHKGAVVYAIGCLLVAFFFSIRVPYWFGMAIFSRTDRNRCRQRAALYIKGAFYALLRMEGLLCKR